MIVGNRSRPGGLRSKKFRRRPYSENELGGWFINVGNGGGKMETGKDDNGQDRA